MRFLDATDAERPYAHLLTGRASLAAAIEAPQRLAHYEGEERLPVLAARLLHAVTQAHALVDGNKRASICLADDFLALNGRRLEGEDDDLYDLAYDAAAGSADEATTAGRIERLVADGAPGAPFTERYPRVIERLAQ